MHEIRESLLSTWMVVLSAGRHPRSPYEAHDHFEIRCLRDIDPMQLRESTASPRRLTAGHYRETKGREPDPERCVGTPHC